MDIYVNYYTNTFIFLFCNVTLWLSLIIIFPIMFLYKIKINWVVELIYLNITYLDKVPIYLIMTVKKLIVFNVFISKITNLN